MTHTLSAPYRAYRPRPITAVERADTTLLFGGLNWRAERILTGAIENLGYHGIEVDLQARGYPVLWAQHLPTDPDMLAWMFASDQAAGLHGLTGKGAPRVHLHE